MIRFDVLFFLFFFEIAMCVLEMLDKDSNLLLIDLSRYFIQLKMFAPYWSLQSDLQH